MGERRPGARDSSGRFRFSRCGLALAVALGVATGCVGLFRGIQPGTDGEFIGTNPFSLRFVCLHAPSHGAVATVAARRIAKCFRK